MWLIFSWNLPAKKLVGELKRTTRIARNLLHRQTQPFKHFTEIYLHDGQLNIQKVKSIFKLDSIKIATIFHITFLAAENVRCLTSFLVPTQAIVNEQKKWK